MAGFQCYYPEVGNPYGTWEGNKYSFPCRSNFDEFNAAPCCNAGDLCLSDGFCKNLQANSPPYRFYVSGCTDLTGYGDACNRYRACGFTFYKNAVFLHDFTWACCYGQDGSANFNCHNPTDRTFYGRPPDELIATASIDKSGNLHPLTTLNPSETGGISGSGSGGSSGDSGDDGSSNLGVYVGVPIGIIVFLILVVCGGVFFYMKKRRQKLMANKDGTQPPPMQQQQPGYYNQGQYYQPQQQYQQPQQPYQQGAYPPAFEQPQQPQPTYQQPPNAYQQQSPNTYQQPQQYDPIPATQLSPQSAGTPLAASSPTQASEDYKYGEPVPIPAPYDSRQSANAYGSSISNPRSPAPPTQTGAPAYYQSGPVPDTLNELPTQVHPTPIRPPPNANELPSSPYAG